MFLQIAAIVIAILMLGTIFSAIMWAEVHERKWLWSATACALSVFLGAALVASL